MMTPVLAEEYVESPKAVKKLDTSIDKIERQLKYRVRSLDKLAQWTKQLNAIRTEAEKCTTDLTEQLTRLTTDIEKLGKPIKAESGDVRRKRNTLNSQKTEFEKRLANCRLQVIRTDEILQQIAKKQKEIIATHLLAKGPAFHTLLLENWQQPAQWFDSTRNFVRKHSGLERLSGLEQSFLVILVLIGVILGNLYRHQHAGKVNSKVWDSSFSNRFYCALSSNFARYAPAIAGSLLVLAYLLLNFKSVRPVPFINVLAYGLPVYIAVIAIIRSFLRPPPPAKRVVKLPVEVAGRFSRRLELLVLLLFIGYLLFATILAQSLPEAAVLLARGVFAAIFILNLIWVVWLVGYLPRLGETLWARAIFILALLSVLVIEWLGYRNLSVWILRTLVGSAFATGSLWLVLRLLRELYHGLNQGRAEWHQTLRRQLGLQGDEHVPGLFWIYLILVLFSWTAFTWVVLVIWGISDTALTQASVYFFEGFVVGSLKVIPARILLAVGVFAVLSSLSGWFKRRLEREWLIHTRMERSARETFVTISGYIGFTIALIIALSVAGFAFTNLAIIAGALSVGIGFGLQNIVNNFVSGLILLFERPIKTGDWIVAGNTEGYVKRIRMRSTLIQTFDRADVIVPNSELISAQVTNWMLYDARGRIKVPVGVAYGTNTQLVKEVLLKVANIHPDVILDGSSPEPNVLFLGFGDSSLNFELRCHIRNIDNRLQCISDLNFAIDAAFRENHIEIPFPQRDIHIRDWRDKPDPT
ncbi:MAG: mechanosensitive ion channel [Gammaproteobacteria bacterium]|nr:mechanosensitive ion channel [Gammaproteobacteria bacterium]